MKLYLLPDPQKTSKKKTKAARRTCNPTYNEMVSQHHPWPGRGGGVLFSGSDPSEDQCNSGAIGTLHSSENARVDRGMKRD